MTACQGAAKRRRVGTGDDNRVADACAGGGAGAGAGTGSGSGSAAGATAVLVPATNNAGGTLGGISSGADIEFRVAIKPVSTIGLPQVSEPTHALSSCCSIACRRAAGVRCRFTHLTAAPWFASRTPSHSRARRRFWLPRGGTTRVCCHARHRSLRAWQRWCWPMRRCCSERGNLCVRIWHDAAAQSECVQQGWCVDL